MIRSVKSNQSWDASGNLLIYCRAEYWYDAITIPEPTGVGVADTALYDERGPLGRAMQALLIAERQA